MIDTVFGRRGVDQPALLIRSILEVYRDPAAAHVDPQSEFDRNVVESVVDDPAVGLIATVGDLLREAPHVRLAILIDPFHRGPERLRASLRMIPLTASAPVRTRPTTAVRSPWTTGGARESARMIFHISGSLGIDVVSVRVNRWRGAGVAGGG